MSIRKLDECKVITALDGTILRELLNPLHDGPELKVGYSIAHALIKPGSASYPHRLTRSSEVYYFLHGEGIMHVDEQCFEVAAGSLIYVPPNAKQFLENTGKTEVSFLCIVDPYWRPEHEELAD